MKTIYFAGGCFWGTQKYFDQFEGVTRTEVGYANGPDDAPSYEDVCASSGHAETVLVEYDEKVISLEKLISDSKESYYDALQDSSLGWHEGENDYLPFVRYMLGVILAAYREFAARAEVLVKKGLSKPDRVRELIRGTTGRITKAEIMAQCPDISQVTVQRALKELLDKGDIIKIGGGRYTSYTWNWEKE